jgi:hypothetical protein
MHLTDRSNTASPTLSNTTSTPRFLRLLEHDRREVVAR